MAIFKRRRRSNSGPGSGNAGQMLNLSLFIMLLAFFIVLNTLSSYEEFKVEKVRRSVEVAFSKDAKIREELPSQSPAPVEAMKEGHSFDRIDALFKAQISSFKSTMSKSRGVMIVTVEYDAFEKAVMAPKQYNFLQYPSRRAIRKNFFLPTLVSMMRQNIGGMPTRMEMLLQIDDNPAEVQNLKPEDMQDHIRKVGRFSSRLEEQGLPKRLMNIGVKKGNPKFIELVFRKYVHFSPVMEEEKKK